MKHSPPYREYSQFNDLHQGRKKVSKYSDKEKRDTVDYYFSHECNALKTVRELGYRDARFWYNGLRNYIQRKEKNVANPSNHM